MMLSVIHLVSFLGNLSVMMMCLSTQHPFLLVVSLLSIFFFLLLGLTRSGEHFLQFSA